MKNCERGNMIAFDANTKKFKQAINKRLDDYKVAEYRALNKVSSIALRETAQIASKEYPVKQKDVRRAVDITKANKRKDLVKWLVEGHRLKWHLPRQLKNGVSFTGIGRERYKVTDHIKDGSKPFVIRGRNSGKKVAVYVPNAWRNNPNLRRRVKTLYHSSIPHMVKKLQIDKGRFIKILRTKFPDEFEKQLARARYR